MIASPGDVSEERTIVREVIHEWNDLNANASGVVLSPVGWETHSSPELGSRPQELINRRVLNDCDLLVGVFWTRIGTPTGKAESGTVEEIQEHIEAGKPAMLYFSRKPVAPQNLDPVQFNEVEKFKVVCRSSGLIEEYDTPDEFRSKFYRHLQIILAQNPYIKSLISNDRVLPNTGFSENNPTSYKLSTDAITLLKAAATDQSGTIVNARYIGGHEIKTGSQSFGGQSGRESAKWESALDELVKNGLAVDKGYKGEIYELTHQGWMLADEL
jgi:hypothetical protein